MTSINSQLSSILNAATQKQAPKLLESHTDLTPTQSKTLFAEDFYSKTEFKGAYGEAALDIVQNALTDGEKNVVALEASKSLGYANIVNYQATNTDDFVQGQTYDLGGGTTITLLLVDDDPYDDSQQVTLRPQVGEMLADHPDLRIGSSQKFYAEDFDSKEEMLLAIALTAAKMEGQYESDGYRNIITVESNQKDGSMALVNYEASSVADFELNEKLELDGYLSLEIAHIDKNPHDD